MGSDGAQQGGYGQVAGRVQGECGGEEADEGQAGRLLHGAQEGEQGGDQ